MPGAIGALEQIDLRSATAAQYAALTVFYNRMRAEALPDDPPIDVQERTARWQMIPEFVDVNTWAIWDAAGADVIAAADVSFLRMEENQHLVQFNIEVSAEQRRHGLARQLLAELVDVPRREGRRLMVAETNDRLLGGAAFMERIGARRARESHTNQLMVEEVDRELLRAWQAQARERAAGFELRLWTGPYPEADIEAIAELMEVMNGDPRGDFEIDDVHFGPEHIRQQEASMEADGTERWTMYARERATGTFAGFTEVFWHPNRPALLYQGGTGVVPAYRNHGLGRWLKAAMLEKVLRERPTVTVIRTGNADSNAPMLHINHALGFKPYMAEHGWQVETATVEQYLATSAQSAMH